MSIYNSDGSVWNHALHDFYFNALNTEDAKLIELIGFSESTGILQFRKYISYPDNDNYAKYYQYDAVITKDPYLIYDKWALKNPTNKIAKLLIP